MKLHEGAESLRGFYHWFLGGFTEVQHERFKCHSLSILEPGLGVGSLRVVFRL